MQAGKITPCFAKKPVELMSPMKKKKKRNEGEKKT